MIDDRRIDANELPPTRFDAPETTKEAARRFIGQTGKTKRVIWDFLREVGPNGATDDEMQERLEMKHQTQTATRRLLSRAGLVVDSGERRLTRSGRRATVWLCADLTDFVPPVDETPPKAGDPVWVLGSRERARGRLRFEDGEWVVDIVGRTVSR